jgi:hypothetical protein
VFGLTKNTLLLAFGIAGVNARMLRDWHARRLLPDPWAVEIGEQHQPPPPGMQPTRRRPPPTITAHDPRQPRPRPTRPAISLTLLHRTTPAM